MGIVSVGDVVGQCQLLPYSRRILAKTWKTATLLVFAAWVLFVGSHHEPWFDEAQAWLLARDNGLWSLLGERVRYEGTPGLWHAILWVAIKAGLPYSKLFLLPASFAIAGAAVVLWRAPFAPALRIAVLTSYFFGYQFSVVARSYCLDLLLVPLAATLFASRVEHPLRYAAVVGLIANANTHGFMAAGLLGAELTVRLWSQNKLFNRASIGALSLGSSCAIVALFMAWQPADNHFLLPEFQRSFAISFLIYVSNAFVDQITILSDRPTVGGQISGFILSIGLMWPVIRLVSAGRNKLFALSLMCALILLSLLVYASPWHSGMLFLFWVFLLWIHWDDPTARSARHGVAISLSIICLGQAAQMVRTGIWDVENSFSAGQPAAQAVQTYQKLNPDNSITAFGYKAFEIQPWLVANFFSNYHKGSPTPSYVLWDIHEPWSARVTLPLWQQLLDSAPDLIVSSSIDRGVPRDLIPLACKAGYGIYAKFSASMMWRGIILEDQSLTLFKKGATRGCSTPSQN